METFVEPPGVPGGSVVASGRKLFTGGEPVGGITEEPTGEPGESSRRETGSEGCIGAPSPSRRGTACSVRWTRGSSGRAGSTGAGSAAAGGSGATSGTTGVSAAAGVSTGDGSAIAWSVRTGGVTVLPADVSSGPAAGAATAGSTSGRSAKVLSPAGESTRCTAGPGAATGTAGRTRSPMTPAGSAGPTRCPSGSR
ncbi:hypothetical protein ACWEGE_02100 [Amycolatopsis sp. NPDC004747]